MLVSTGIPSGSNVREGSIPALTPGPKQCPLPTTDMGASPTVEQLKSRAYRPLPITSGTGLIILC